MGKKILSMAILSTTFIFASNICAMSFLSRLFTSFFKTPPISLYQAAGEGDLEQGADIEAQDDQGMTPLHYAAWNGKLEVAKYLIEKGVNKEAQDESGYTPFHHAAWNGKLEVVKYLVEKGANKEAQDKFGNTPLHLAVEGEKLEVVECLIEKGANKEAQDKFGNTPLHLAAGEGDLEIVKYLVEKGANIEAKDNKGDTPLHRAAWYGYLKVVEYLVDNGANKATNINCFSHVANFLKNAQQALSIEDKKEQIAEVLTNEFLGQQDITTIMSIFVRRSMFKFLKQSYQKGFITKVPLYKFWEFANSETGQPVKNMLMEKFKVSESEIQKFPLFIRILLPQTELTPEDCKKINGQLALENIGPKIMRYKPKKVHVATTE
jgi:ankyrin repeat protein